MRSRFISKFASTYLENFTKCFPINFEKSKLFFSSSQMKTFSLISLEFLLLIIFNLKMKNEKFKFFS